MAAIVYKCPSCGANIRFNAKTQEFHCEYCDNSYDAAKMKELEGKLKEKKTRVLASSEGKMEYHCGDCGATIISDENTVATFCLYCQNPSVIRTHVENDFTPDLVIPFKITKEDAISTYKKWCEKRILVPEEFKNIKQQEKMSGLYVPYWLYDVRGSFRYELTGTKITSWTSLNYHYTKTDHYKIIRNGYADFIKVPADGSSKMDDEEMSRIEPFDYKDIKEFQSGYLSGFYAEKYDEDDKAKFEKVSPKLIEEARGIVDNTILGYSGKKYLKNDLNIDTKKVYYAFLPVWILTYKYNDKVYKFVMNGQTGKIEGDLPISKGQSFWFFIKVFIATFIISYIVRMVSL